MRKATVLFLIWLSVASLGALVPHGAVEGSSASESSTSEWWTEVERLQTLLAKEKWKAAHRNARNLADSLISKSWYGPDLDKVLAQIALVQAVADGNLHRDRRALWYWHMACNLDPGLKRHDLAGFGRAAKLFREFPLRARGRMPAPFKHRESTPLTRSTRVKPPSFTMPSVVNSSGAVRERPGDFHAEVIVDKEGRLHQPVVMGDYHHPIVVYALLRWMLDLPPFEPRTIEGEATDSLYPLVVEFNFKRW